MIVTAARLHHKIEKEKEKEEKESPWSRWGGAQLSRPVQFPMPRCTAREPAGHELRTGQWVGSGPSSLRLH